MHLTFLLLLSALSTLASARCCVVKLPYTNTDVDYVAIGVLSDACKQLDGTYKKDSYRDIGAKKRFRAVCIGVSRKPPHAGYVLLKSLYESEVTVHFVCEADNKPGDSC